ncbi:transposable element Tcb2 transposase [Trichonephila clavipes]|nr:transposable element Tcb2 transposase [Trichonephila clavipes]
MSLGEGNKRQLKGVLRYPVQDYNSQQFAMENIEWHECMDVSMTTPGNSQLYISNKEIEEIMNQRDFVSKNISEGNSEDVALPDEVDIFVENEEMKRDTGSDERKPRQVCPRATMTKIHHLSICEGSRNDTLFSSSVSYGSHFKLTSDFRRTFIWREPGTYYLPSNVLEIDHKGSVCLTIWRGITLDGSTHFHVFERGTVTATRYRLMVLKPYLRLLTGAVGSDFVLMEDNKRLHGTHLVNEFLESEDILWIYWPVRSPIFIYPYGAFLGPSGEDNCNSLILSENYPRLKNRVSERMGVNATEIHKLSHFQHKITVRGLHISVRGDHTTC